MRVLYTSLLVVIVDQITKLLVKGLLTFKGFYGLEYGRTISLIRDRINFTFIENPGIAFGMYFGPLFKLIVPLVSILISAALIYDIYKNKDGSFLRRLSSALILGGAIGNLIDRIFYGVLFHYASLFNGKVVDFIDIRFNRFSGNYIFNLADFAVFTGLVFFLSTLNTKKKTLPVPIPQTQPVAVSQLFEKKELN